MSGTNPVGTWTLPLSTGPSVQDPTTYKGNIDASIAVAQRIADMFAPHPASPAAMSVAIDAGFVTAVSPTGLHTTTEVAAQTVTVATAPSSPNNRIDLVVIDGGTGTVSIIAGTAAASPVAPSLPAGKRQIAQVSVPNGPIAIGSSNITDLRTVWSSNVPGIAWAVAAGTADAITASYTPANAALVDGLILGFRATAANATTAPTFNADSLGAKTITKSGGQALAAGDIPANLAECLVRYNLAGTRWELLNPAMPYFTTLSPSSLSADQNDYNPTGVATSNTLRLTSSANVNITGLASGTPGRLMTIVNVGSNTITLKNGSTSSTAANRFGLAADAALAPSQAAILEYDAASSLWRGLAIPVTATVNLHQQVFTSSGTFTASFNGTHKITVTGGGGGGGAAGSIIPSGAGGGSAGTVMYWASLTCGSGYATTVGAGGLGGAAQDSSGSAGGNSSFAGPATVTANGGGGGASNNGAGGSGGSASSGTININGTPGSAGSLGFGGWGGGSFWGAGASGAPGAVGVAAVAYGAGGSGGDGAANPGGAGKSGLVIVEWVS